VWAFFHNVLIVVVCLATQALHAGVSFGPSAGYMFGTFSTDDDFSIKGPYVNFDAGFTLGANAPWSLSAGLTTRYAELSYESNGLEKTSKWYYAGGYAGLTKTLGDSAALRFKLGYAPYSKFFVNSSATMTINGSEQTVKENTLYEGGTGTDYSLALLKRSAGKNKYKAVGLCGVEVGGTSQGFTNRTQRASVRKDGEETRHTKKESTGDYSLSLVNIAIVLGIQF
jgi:hypothetical protein